MMEYRRNRKKKKTWLLVVFAALAVVLGIGTGGFLALFLTDNLPGGEGGAPAVVSSASGSGVATSAQSGGDSSAPVVQNSYAAAGLPTEMRAMWISFIEWKKVDFSSEEAFRAAFSQMAANCEQLGLNTIIAAVRPFGDALYQSSIFPHSHVMNGAQGQDPGFDPLAVMIEESHARGLRLEAWINPYRVKHPTNGPDTLSADNPAAENPALVREVGGEMWYDPGMPEVQQLVVDGVLEIVQLYDVDGIHFDDYFYPETGDGSFDAETYAQYGEGMTLENWRRDNVNRMVAAMYAAIKSANASASFGISVQGNNENNYQQMFADVKHWMANEGYVDYVMPQIYWGFAYQTASGRTDAAFANKCAEWAFYPRLDSVALYAGLGVYRIGELQADGTRSGQGDGGAGDQSEWNSGHSMASQVEHLRTVEGFSGFALFRYDFMYQPGDDLSAAEVAALSLLLL